MKLEVIKNSLKAQNFDEQKISRYTSYLADMKLAKNKQGQPVNWWMDKVSEEGYMKAFSLVDSQGLEIDGDTVTLQFKGKLLISYDYRAYKNKIMVAYPESIFDVQVVYEGDEFSFRKESGKVIYTHKINDPFAIDRKILGAYGIIKNRRGEFIETLNMTEINKMRKVAQTQNIWNEWFSEMVKKSVVKRVCKLHFKDVVGEIDKEDNNNYDMSKIDIEVEMQNKIEKCKSLDDLTELYDLVKDDYQGNEEALMQMLKDRQDQIVKSSKEKV